MKKKNTWNKCVVVGDTFVTAGQVDSPAQIRFGLAVGGFLSCKQIQNILVTSSLYVQIHYEIKKLHGSGCYVCRQKASRALVSADSDRCPSVLSCP